MIHVNEISTIIIVTSILIMTSGTGIFSSLVFAQTDSEIDLGNMTLMNTSEVQVNTTLTNGSGVQGDTSGVELPQQQPQGPLSPSTPSQQAQDNVAKLVTLDEDSLKDLLKKCTSTFKCKQDSTTSWDNNTSMQISTTLNNTNSWSWIFMEIISVSPDKGYEVLTHMKLNNWSTQSHIVVEGFNRTSKQWYQLVQCPSGINGPLGWSEFNCKMTIPGDTTMIRPILNAGWSSQPNKQAITWFDTISVTALDRTATIATTPEDISATKDQITNEDRADCRNIGFVMC
jgi:hypothetical protein